ncbi:MAG: hypothetical protein V4649_07535 [Bacteroidota bacterium]
MIAQNQNTGSSFNNPLPYMSTLSSVVNKAVKDGYKDCMQVTRNGLLDTTNEKTYTPTQVRVIDFFRFEGESDPADNSILYKIETADGSKGTLIDAYGPYADENVNKFMAEVEHINKKVNKKDKSQYH